MTQQLLNIVRATVIKKFKVKSKKFTIYLHAFGVCLHNLVNLKEICVEMSQQRIELFKLS